QAPGSSTKGLSGNFRDFGLKNAIFWGSKTQFRTRIVICHISYIWFEGKAKKLDDDKTSISQGSGVVGSPGFGRDPSKLVKNAIFGQGVGNFGLKNAIFGQGNGQIPASKTQNFRTTLWWSFPGPVQPPPNAVATPHRMPSEPPGGSWWLWWLTATSLMPPLLH
ncbi:hypothetical protein B0H14DRAFT_2932788, partial [Mycena olivaceomarginata]